MVDVTGLSYEAPDLTLPPADLWVFGYGSLIWNPGFDFLHTRRARIYGYHRALCVWSWVHRGSQARPGLVMGLDDGGSCIGRAYLVAAGNKDAVADYLYRREMATPAYLPMLRAIRFADSARATALVFRVDRAHPQYAGKLSIEEAVATIRHAAGRSGENPAYVADAVRHLEAMGIRDKWLCDVAAALVDC